MKTFVINIKIYRQTSIYFNFFSSSQTRKVENLIKKKAFFRVRSLRLHASLYDFKKLTILWIEHLARILRSFHPVKLGNLPDLRVKVGRVNSIGLKLDPTITLVTKFT